MKQEHDCRDCRKWYRCNRLDRSRNDRCADFKQKAIKKIAIAMMVIGLIGAYVSIAAMNNRGGAVRLVDFLTEIAFCIVLGVGSYLYGRGEKNGQ